MKQRFLILGILISLLVGAIALAEVPQWIQSEERLVGENSTQYADTLNRPAKSVWNTFLVEHASTGFHNYSALVTNMGIDTSSKLDVSVFEAEHNPDGTHNLSIPSSTDDLTEGSQLFYTETRVSANSDVSANSAHRNVTGNPHALTREDIGAASVIDLDAQRGEWCLYRAADAVAPEIATGATSSDGVYNQNRLTLWGVIALETWDTKQSVYSRSSSGGLLWDFGIDSDNALFFTVGDGLGNNHTYKSSSVLSYAEFYSIPFELGVSWDTTTDELLFFVGGHAETIQTLTHEPAPNLGLEYLSVGDGFNGWIYTLSIQASWPRSPESVNTPLREGLSQCYKCISHYDLDNANDTELKDVWWLLYSIPITGGVWERYDAGY